MFAGAYRFASDPAKLLTAHDRMMSGFDLATLELHVCAVGADGLVGRHSGCPGGG